MRLFRIITEFLTTLGEIIDVVGVWVLALAFLGFVFFVLFGAMWQ